METVGIISTVRAPYSQLKAFVNFHHNIGIDHIVLFFDDPEDEAFSKFCDVPGVIAVRCNEAYWNENAMERPGFIEERQKVNVNNGVEYLTAKQCTWSVHIDCDELINPLKPLKSLLAASQSEVVRFAIFEAVAEKEEYESLYTPNLFRKQSRKKIVRFARKTGFFSAFFDGEFFRGHTMSKSAIRIKPEFKHQYGIHGLDKSVKASKINTDAIQLLHFDCVSFDAWKTKWDRRLDGTGVAAGMRPNRRKQMQYYQTAKSEGEVSPIALFNRLHNIRSIERPFLYLFNMIKRVRLQSDLFENATE